MSNEVHYDHDREEYADDNVARYVRTSKSQRSRTPMSRKRSKSPQSVNGLHRRRRRKMTW